MKAVTACSAVLAFLATATTALPNSTAPSNKQRASAVGPRTYLTVPRRAYPGVARPPSLYEVYDSLKGKRWCWLPSEPCDNTERIAN